MDDQLIDIGVNLMHRSFDQDRDEVVAKALAAGVSPLLLTGTSVRNSEGAARYVRTAGGSRRKLRFWI
jgi:TatD DNase family protein